MIEPFNPAVPEGELEALRLRLRATRWPEAETDPSQGLAIGELQELCAYWCDGYDWRRCEATLNGFGQYRTQIDGLDIHFLHARSPHAEALHDRLRPDGFADRTGRLDLREISRLDRP